MIKKVLSYVLGVILIAGGIAHVVVPDSYAPMIPDFISALLANILAAIAELVVGVLLFLPKYRHWGGFGFFLLMIAFLPIHIWDLLKENPAIGPSPAPEIRLVVQFLFIYAGWWIYKKAKPLEA